MMSIPSGPHFVGIGAQKAGTNWLYQQLGALPQYALLPKKELHYFDRHPQYLTTSFLQDATRLGRFRQKGRGSKAAIQILSALKAGNLRNAKFYLKWHFGAYTDQWYRGLFDPNQGYGGEICPGYALLNTEDIQRMRQAIPEAKILFMVRNPIARAWSQVRYHKANWMPGGELNTDHVLKFLASQYQMQRSDYLATLRRFAQVYPAELLRIGFYDAILEQPLTLLKEVTDYLGPVPEADLARYCQVGLVHNSSRVVDCPQEISDFLKDQFQSMMAELADLLGGYATQWHQHLLGNTVVKNPLQMPAATTAWPKF